MVEPSLIGRLTAEARDDGVHELAVGALVQHDGQLLLLLRRPGDDGGDGTWEVPSGTVHPGERLDQAVARQVRAATNLAVSGLLQHLGSFDSASDNGLRTRQFNFAVAVAAAGPVELREHVAFRWIPLESSASRPTSMR